MKTLIIYYSRTGTTKKVAELMQYTLDCDIEEIVDTKNRKGPVGYIMAGRDANMRTLTTIQPISKKVNDFELVLIGTPVWSWNVSTPVRTFLQENKENLKQVAYFCTMGGNRSERTFTEMEKVCNIKPIATLALTTKEVLQNQFKNKLVAFVNNLSKEK
jgi:flavodoxin